MIESHKDCESSYKARRARPGLRCGSPKCVLARPGGLCPAGQASRAGRASGRLPFRHREDGSQVVEGLGGGKYEDKGGSLLWHRSLANLVPDFGFPFLDDLRRFLVFRQSLLIINPLKMCIEELDREVRSRIASRPMDIKILRSIPGIGMVSAYAILAEIGNY